MKKKITYRDKLLELAKIYNVKEIREYIKRRKNLTSGQIELILRKNKIIIPKDFQTNFFKENITKPIFKVSKDFNNFKDDSKRNLNKLSRRISYFKDDSLNKVLYFFSNTWKNIGNVGVAFLNIFPKLWETIYNFIGSLLTDLFNGIYNQKINTNKANQAIIGFFVIVGIVTIVISGITTFNSPKNLNQDRIVKKQDEIKKSKDIIKKDITKQKSKKIDPKIKKEVKKEVKKNTKKQETKNKKKVAEAILPNLN